MRVKSDTFSRNGGFIHRYNEKVPVYIPPIKQEPEIKINAFKIWHELFKKTNPDKLKLFAQKLGVEVMALHLLGCAWSPLNNAWAFPMKDVHENVIGIRLRNEQGDKWAIKGSKQGLFMAEMTMQKYLLIVEGPTDLAAALTLGYCAIGRPSCRGMEKEINDFAIKHHIRDLIIISDNDTPGLLGAEKLQEEISIHSTIVIPPCKDLRQFLNYGGTKEVLDSLIKNSIWYHPKNNLK